MGTRQPSRLVRFGVFEFDVETGDLWNRGHRVRLQDQPRQVLAMLLARPGDVVSRQALRAALWPNDTFVDFDAGMNVIVNKLRQVLRDSASTPRFIETLPRRGYRFIAPVEPVPVASDVRVDVPERVEEDTQLPAPPRAVRRFDVSWLRGLGSIPRPSRIGLLFAAMVAALLASWVAWDASRGAPSNDANADIRTEVPEGLRNKVTVAVFENRAGDNALASVGQLVAERIITTVAGVTGVQVAPHPIDMGTGAPAEPAASNGEVSAPLQVIGTYHVRQGVLEFHARILDATTGGLLHAVASDTATQSSPVDGVQLIAQRVAGAVAIHFDEFFGGLHAVSHAPTLDAYREYRAGLEIFWSDYDRAMAHLERALEMDPAFLHAQLIMFFAHGNLGESDKAELMLGRMEAAWDRLTPAERLLVEFLRAHREGRRAQALRLLYDLEPLVPSSLFVNSNLVMLSVRENRPHAAVVAYDKRHFEDRTLRHSIDILRQDFLIEALHMLSDYDRELQQAKLAQEYAPGDLHQLEAEARALVAIGRDADVAQVIDRSLSVTPLGGPPHSPGEVMEGVAREFRAHGYRAESIALARRAVDWYRSRPADIAASRTNRAGLARAVYLTERWEEADALFSALLVEARDDVGYLGYLGAIAARTNDVPRARGIAARLARVTGRVAASRANYERVRIAALLQERQHAVDLLRDALTQGLEYTRAIHSDLDLESLRDYPPFVELLRPRG